MITEDYIDLKTIFQTKREYNFSKDFISTIFLLSLIRKDVNKFCFFQNFLLSLARKEVNNFVYSILDVFEIRFSELYKKIVINNGNSI